ncbi:MAG: hypothetical protein M0R77_19140 [Gammaproteobacteria bacterium]|nr:hypothetical protein [Gammaproteobacteria bacterium]
MAIIVGTNSYVTEAELTAYAATRGVTLTVYTEIALFKAMDYIETRNYIGSKTDYTQALQFPRVLCGSVYSGAYPLNQYQTYWNIPCEYDSTVVPNEIKTAQMIAAILIDSGYDLQPIINRQVKREKVDVLEVEYMNNALSSAQFTALNDILRPFIVSGLRAQRI